MSDFDMATGGGIHVVVNDGEPINLQPFSVNFGSSYDGTVYIFEQAAAATEWAFINPFGSKCAVDVFVNDKQTTADVTVTNGNITIVLPEPLTGEVFAYGPTPQGEGPEYDDTELRERVTTLEVTHTSLDGRVTALEAVPPGTYDDTELRGRIEVLESDPPGYDDTEVRDDITALESAVVTAQSAADAADTHADALDTQLAATNTRVTALEDAPTPTPYDDTAVLAGLSAVEDDVTALETSKVDTTDVRLSDTRTPKAHTHPTTDVTGLDTALASKVGTDDLRLTNARPPTAHVHAIADVQDLPTTLANKVSTDDARLSNPRTPTAHTHSASDIASGTLGLARGGTGGTTAATARTALGAASATDVSGLTTRVGDVETDIAALESADVDLADLISVLDDDLATKVGTSDPRLTDSRTPTAHTHAQADVIGLDTSLAAKASTSDPRFTDARTPTAHTHAQSEVVGLSTALSGKANTSALTALDGEVTALQGDMSTAQSDIVDLQNNPPSALSVQVESGGSYAVPTDVPTVFIGSSTPTALNDNDLWFKTS